jgi:methylated-DNA-[protein]-cysteine S-methyltransferase
MTSKIESALREAADRLPDPPDPAGAVSALAERASAEGLLDVAYATVDSPLGPLMVAGTPNGLVRLSYSEFRDDEAVLSDLARRVSPRVLEAPARVDRVRRELDEYFEGHRTKFELPIDWTLTRGFTTEVLRATAAVGFGHTTTYSEVARTAGSPRAVRAAGNSLGSNPMPIVVPCHRVLRTGGGLGGYTGGLERKEFLLRLEGAII